MNHIRNVVLMEKNILLATKRVCYDFTENNWNIITVLTVRISRFFYVIIANFAYTLIKMHVTKNIKKLIIDRSCKIETWTIPFVLLGILCNL